MLRFSNLAYWLVAILVADPAMTAFRPLLLHRRDLEWRLNVDSGHDAKLRRMPLIYIADT
jgi:hypothetical protein